MSVHMSLRVSAPLILTGATYLLMKSQFEISLLPKVPIEQFKIIM